MEYITIIKTFLSSLSTKFYIYSGLVLVYILSVFFSYQIGHSKGYDQGVFSEKEKLSKEYDELITKKLKENTDRLQKQFNLALESEKVKEKTITIFKDRVVTVKELVKDQNIAKSEFELTKEQVDKLNQLRGLIK